MTCSLRMVMLLSDGFGGFGGIAKFNRDFLWALDASRHVERVHALPRTIPEPIDGDIPEAVVYDRRSAIGNVSYVRRLIRHLLRREPVDVVICGHMHLLPAAWVLARTRRACLVLVIHGVEAWAPDAGWPRRWFSRRIDALISVSRLSAERFSAWSHWPLSRTFILPNCVDLDRFTPQPKSAALMAKHSLDGGRLIMTLGRLAANERTKGFDEVIAVMPRLLRAYPDLKYMIVGDGPDRARLAAKSEALGLAGHVIFAGRVAEADKPGYYNLADAYVMSSAGEGFGIVLIEAAACGVPVIGSMRDGSREALLDGALGTLVEPDDPDALYAAIAKVLDENRPKARNRLVETFSRDRFVGRVGAWTVRMCDAVYGSPPRAARGRIAS